MRRFGPGASEPVARSIRASHGHRPGLLAVDTGSRFGAGGTTATANGSRLSYRAGAGDTLNDIADRFGITLDGLGFLNPLTSRQLQAGDELDLRVALRGGASVPPPLA